MSVKIIVGDCRDVLKTLPDASVDSIVTDPPYELTSGKKGGTGAGGFMGLAWDSTGVAFDAATWLECLRVLKPGGHMLAFSGTRTYHRMVCAIEDAGFEIRDCIFWHYGQGFPKSHNLDKERGRAVCGCEPMERVAASSEHDVRSMRETDLQAAEHAGSQRHQVVQPQMPEPTARERSPAHAGNDLAPSEVAARGKERRVEGRGDAQTSEGELHGGPLRARSGLGAADGAQGRLHHGASAGDGAAVRLPADAHGSCRSPGPQPGEQRAEQSAAVSDERGSQTRRGWQVCAGCGKPILPKGLGTALKPTTEPIVMARKSLDGTVIANVLKHGTGALNIDGCRVATDGESFSVPQSDPTKRAGTVGTDLGISGATVAEFKAAQRASIERTATLGRWPANLIHDGSDEVLAAFPQAPGQIADVSDTAPSAKTGRVYGPMARAGEPSADSENAGAVGFKMKPGARRGDSGSAARFFKSFPQEQSCEQPSDAPTAQPSSSLRSALAASVQSAAAIWPSLAGIVSSDWTAPSTVVTESESRTLCEAAITAMASIGSGFSRESRHEKRSLCNSRVSVAVTSGQTGITTITASLWRSDGFAEDVTFSITPTPLDRGEQDCARFKYCAKASREDRNAGCEQMPKKPLNWSSGTQSPGTFQAEGTDRSANNNHPTVKPTELMRYLCRLVTPPGGVVLDPFMGSGSTLKAAELEGFDAIGIELSEEYAEIARRRIGADSPLFAEVTS